ncbi:unnamed protein product [Caenorhabditis auriculariae]|uniref:G-protein coupled receptors family 1 profile domain-containing protein n=1 Tax=Caenorhabditis auriculariae TaxID=2777116 RepID=A0A8S1H584_9PELO|nr:unnamed protein product [Caenorhabditis auriculariae]
MNDTTNDTEISCDTSYEMRYISLGTAVSAIGLALNTFLLYVLISRNIVRTYPFQTFLAFLDAMLCSLYIYCFFFAYIATMYRIEFLYTAVLDSNVVSLTMSKVVQAAIPYTILANSADKVLLVMIRDAKNARVQGCLDKFVRRSSNFLTCSREDQRSAFTVRVRVCVIILISSIVLRGNTLFTHRMGQSEDCDFFQSKWIEMDSEYREFWRAYEGFYNNYNTGIVFVMLLALHAVLLRELCRKTNRAKRSNQQQQESLISRMAADQERREQNRKLRYATRTAGWILGTYLACSAMNIALLYTETFYPEFVIDPDGNFNEYYVKACDLASTLVTLSSAVRIVLYYSFNPEIRHHIQSVIRRRKACKDGFNPSVTAV